MQENKKMNFVIGLGRSGFWAAKYLKETGMNVTVIENKTNATLEETKKELELLSIKVLLNQPFEYKTFSNSIHDIESIILSPGINLDNKTVLDLKKSGVKISGEINIGWDALKHLNWVGITGTNGKSTVTHLLSHILQCNDFKAPTAGNIGTPLCKYAYECNTNDTKLDWIVAELSSYQLEMGKEIKPKIGIWTTFTPDHLERHKTIENYFNIKNNLLIQSEFRIYNYDDKHLRESVNILSKGIWVTTSCKEEYINRCDYWINEKGYIIEQGKSLFKIDEFKLIGQHNLQNLLLAIAAVRKIGLKEIEIKKALKTYIQLPHRLETIYKTKSLEIINDSKATNFDSSIAGINSVKGSPIIICGGIIKDGDSNSWVSKIKDKADSIFLYGESAKTLQFLLKKGGFRREIYIYNDLSELINAVLCYAENKKIKTILFSPSCSSFDQFKDFEERGNHFKSIVKRSLKKKT